MAKERLHNLQQTKHTFSMRGIITGMKSEKAYRSGTGKSGGKYNAAHFGLKINDNKVVYLDINGFPKNEVYYYKKSEVPGQKGDTVRVAWNNRDKAPGPGYNLMGIQITTERVDGNNTNKAFTEWDAVEHIHNNFHDGMSVYVGGNMVFSSYTDKNGDIHRKTQFVPTQIYFTEPIDFNDSNFEEMAEFTTTNVFSNIEKETDENGKDTGRFIFEGYSIGYNNIENISFIIEKNHSKLANNIRKRMKPSDAMKMYGRVSITHMIEQVVDDDDDWGNDPNERSPMETAVKAPSKTEYIVYKVDGKTFDKETYSEESIAEALRAIKSAKTASEKFVDKDEVATVDEWNGDDDDMGDDPW